MDNWHFYSDFIKPWILLNASEADRALIIIYYFWSLFVDFIFILIVHQSSLFLKLENLIKANHF